LLGQKHGEGRHVSEINPKGTAFVGLVGELTDLLAKPDISRIEVVIGSFALDESGKRKLFGGQASLTTRAFQIGGMNEEVRESLRKEFDASPVNLLMILWTDRSPKGPVGFVTFDADTNKQHKSISELDEAEKSTIAAYTQRQK
jgi:hypothetical protein